MISILLAFSAPMIVLGIAIFIFTLFVHCLGKVGHMIIPEIAQGILLIVAIVLFSSGIFFSGVKWSNNKHEQKVSALVERQKIADAQVLNLNEKLVEALNGKIQTIVKVEKQVVTKYVTKKADDNCVIPLGFIRIHDSAATGTIVPPSTEDVDANSGVQLSLAAEVIKQNYSLYNKLAAEHDSLIRWVIENKEIQDSVVEVK